MAFTMWVMGLMGVAPEEEDMVRYVREFRERGHHLTVDVGGQRTGTTRWSDSNWSKRVSVGLGYHYLVDREYHGVGLEALVQSLGPVIDPDRDVNSFFVGGGLAYYPVRPLRLFMQAGPEIGVDGDTEAVGRIGLGYRMMFFKLGMQPFAYVQTSTTGQFSWSIQFRFEY